MPTECPRDRYWVAPIDVRGETFIAFLILLWKGYHDMAVSQETSRAELDLIQDLDKFFDRYKISKFKMDVCKAYRRLAEYLPFEVFKEAYKRKWTPVCRTAIEHFDRPSIWWDKDRTGYCDPGCGCGRGLHAGVIAYWHLMGKYGPPLLHVGGDAHNDLNKAMEGSSVLWLQGITPSVLKIIADRFECLERR
jgi:hypothetical protein